MTMEAMNETKEALEDALDNLEKVKDEHERYKKEVEKLKKSLDKGGYFHCGTITLSNKAVVSDPSYALYTWCAAILDNVLPGEYNCYLRFKDFKGWGMRVVELMVTHKDYPDIRFADDFESEEYDIGVDSGICGIYDFEYFDKIKESETDNEDWLMNRVFPTTYDQQYGILRGGTLDSKCIISSTGFGDGCYDLFTKKDEAGNIIGMMVMYIYDEED